jgi:hypothetical protein
MRAAHPIIAVASLLLTAACGNAGEVKEARTSAYDTDFAVVYGETLQAVQEIYPSLDENPTKGKVSTAWHQVQYSNDGADDPKSLGAQNRALGFDQTGVNTGGTGGNAITSPTSQSYKRYFIRFDVTVAGGRPWRIRVTGHASVWEPGNAVPSELRGAATPHWLPGRTEALLVAIHRKLKKYAIELHAPEAPPPDAAPAVDLGAFGPIPADAVKRLVELRQAIAQRDVEALRPQLAADVTWSLGGAPGVDGALAMWQADPAILAAMTTAIDAGCRGDDAEVVCPPAATESPGYTGWRLTLVHRGQQWLVTSFVQGD